MLRIAVVEDDDRDYANLKDVLDRFQKEKKASFEIVRFPSGEDFRGHLSDRFDIVFLDIDLKDDNGIDLAKALRETGSKTNIIFVTNLAQFAIKGYEVEALDFVVKPVSYFDFSLKIQKAIDKVKTHRDASITIYREKEPVTLLQSEITYVEIMHHSLIVHTLTQDFKSYGSLKDIESKVNPGAFSRCNNCYLVNLAHVSSVQGYSVMVHDTTLLISHPRKKDFMRALNNYLNGEK